MLYKLIFIERPPLYNGWGHPLDSQSTQLHYFLLVYKGQQIELRSNHEQTLPCVTQRHGKMNARDIVKSVNLFMAIKWGELQALDELNIQFSLQETYI